MKLSKLVEGMEYVFLQGDMDCEIKKIDYDSRKVEEGSVFLCVTGFKTDGHIYAKSAVEKGAVALVCERDIEGIDSSVTIIKVASSRAALSILSENFYDHPASKMTMVGVTGTNGKTTTTYLVKSVLDHIGNKVGVVGTIENRIGDKRLHTERTTPESLELCELFDMMVKEDVTHTLMEVSSHSLDLHRVDCCKYDVGIFTNLTQDHLDYHITMDNYKAAKGKLFEISKNAVINIDDAAGSYMISKAKGRILTFGIDNDADLKAENMNITANGVTYTLKYEGNEYVVDINIPGKFSIYNSLGSIGACLIMGIAMEDILAGLKENYGVPGRFQTIKSNRGFNAIVDYAHTPDGLENILNTAKEFVKGRIITVFGCGGDRDRTKRPIMGEIGGRLSDICIITSDNPRTEDPEQILKDVEEGTKKTGCPYECICDRKEAIFRAVEIAQEGDLVVVAGKGHEDYQIFKDKTIHFDDAEIIREAFGE
ncbi:MAG: UDP-N-acetylmuramoyl-L-alanyl-D-glutamate--2,6-diaminopimelate ligase [Lachnospiraceae bacterium]|nr:UDP-N-acetylmuramoyl-L-alanyl-D-glutamate--2,6-diaminopimelate ligase [Lachnospiraceae bacterium]